jgi:hypothetical protein
MRLISWTLQSGSEQCQPLFGGPLTLQETSLTFLETLPAPLVVPLQPTHLET